MKHGHALAIGLLAMALVACGGNGGGKRSTDLTDPNIGLTQDYRIEAVLSDPTRDPNYTYQDPLNLQVNDRVTFQLVYYTNGGATRNVVPTAAETGDPFTGVTFTTSAPNSSGSQSPGGNLSTTDGQFSAPATDSGTTRYTVSANYRGNIYATQYQINPQTQQIRLRGRVLSEGTLQPVYNAVVDFYAPRTSDPSSRPVVIGSVRTGFDGTFRASLRALNDDATAATLPLTFSIRRSALPVGAGTSFVFQGARYDILDPDACRATSDPVNDPTFSLGIVDPDTGLPFQSGERTLVPLDSSGSPVDPNPITNGTILLASSATDTTTDAANGIVDGCAGSSSSSLAAARVKAAVKK